MNVEALSIGGTLPSDGEAARTGARAPGTPRPVGNAPAQAAPGAAGDRDAHRAIAEANRQLAQKASELTFEFDDSAARVVVRLIDKQTGQVLRQIPSKEALQIARALQDESTGALLRTDA
jgi:flagellar protein FlaG